MVQGLCHATLHRRWRGLLILGVLAAASCSGSQPAPQESHATPQQPAPETIGTVELANEARVAELLSATKGKPLVVNVWATWCMPCVAEMPELAKFYRASEKLGVGFLSLSADMTSEVDGSVKPFVKDKKVPFPVYVLDSLPPDRLVEMLKAEDSKWDGPLPATFLFDKDGVMKQFWFEEVTEAQLTEAVSALGAGA
ncbi:MAG: redoxin domain-containing protein [Candidatus Hydrogenedentes bacterium]|nr:redoxin domain-containing protein [Candidatus Hydrogenedentota bacterium]